MSDTITTDLPTSLLESLRQKNPFASNAAADPWFNGFPDIAAINRRAFEEIRTLIERKSVHPRMSLAGMILGEAGEGKTHLLRRILTACQRSESPSLFVFVKPLFDHKRPLHHLLREIVLCLSKTSAEECGFSQFDRLVAEIMRDYVRFRVTRCPQDATPNNKKFLEQFETDVYHIFTNSDKVCAGSMEIIEKQAVNFIHSEVPETSKLFLDVVFQYKTPEKRGLVRDWIKGSVLDEDACETLGVASRADQSDGAGEQEAREIILTLGILFERYRLPMVICFDQLDNLIHPDLITGFASMIHLLVNDAANMLPLAFIREDSWIERFQNHPDRAFVDRMVGNEHQLYGCNKEEAKELAARRVEHFFGVGTDEADTIISWLLPLLESKLKGLNSPREVIMFANKIIRDAFGKAKPVLPAVGECLASEYKIACEAVAVDFDTWDPESEYLQQAAELFLTNQDNVLSCQPGENKYMAWTGTLKASDAIVPYACFVNTTRNAGSVSAALNRCIAFLQKHPNGICTYVTDARCDFKPTWIVANERRRKVESLGGNIVILDQPAAVRWYGLVSLSWKIGSGDILLESESGLRPATEKDLADFLKTGFSAHASEGLFDRLTKKKPPVKMQRDDFPTIDELIRAVRECLVESTIPVLKMEALLPKLRDKGIIVTREWCLEQIGKNQNVFCLLPAGDGFSVCLVV